MPLTPGLDFDRTGLTEIPVASWAEPKTVHFAYRLRDDHLVREFCVLGAIGPNSVETLAPDGTPQKWASHWDGDMLVFVPPDGYAGAQGLLWMYDKRLQRGVAMDRPALERFALNGRASVRT